MNWSIAILLAFLCAYVAAQTSGTAHVTYHLYKSTDSITTVACSDGANGIQTKYKHKTLAPMFPGVTASSLISGWNSNKCGTCYKMTKGSKTIYAAGIDSCGPPPAGNNAHFDLSQTAFTNLGCTIAAGTCKVSWSVAAASKCKGLK